MKIQIGQRLLILQHCTRKVREFTSSTSGDSILKLHQPFVNRIYRASSTAATVKLSHTVFDPASSHDKDSRLAPIIFLHGLFGSKRNWESIAKVFCRTGRKIVTVDARNHGDSPHHEDMNYHVMSNDVAQLIDDLGLGRPIVVGHSMGGKTCMLLALTKPQLVDRLIVEDIAPAQARSTLVSGFPKYIAAMKAAKFDQSLTSLAQVRKSIGQQLTADFPDKTVRDFILTNVDERDGRYLWRLNMNSLDQHLDELIGFPDNITTTFDRPTLFIGGKLSPLISEPFYPEIRRLFPMSTIQHIDGAGHWVHSEKPHDFIKLVHDFIQ